MYLISRLFLNIFAIIFFFNLVTCIYPSTSYKEKINVTISKCCPAGQQLLLNISIGGLECSDKLETDAEVDWSGFLYDKHTRQRLENDKVTESFIFHHEHKVLTCNYTAHLSTDENANILFKLLTDGSVSEFCNDCPQCKKWKLVSTEFCVDGLSMTTENGRMTYNGREDEQILLVCPAEDHKTNLQNSIPILYAWVYFLTSFIYLIICIIYILLWKNHNVHGWTIFGLISSRFLMCMFLGIAHLFVIFGYRGKTFFCIGNGVLAHYFILASFSWMTVLCFDLWWTFRSMTPREGLSIRSILQYVSAGLGIPLIVVIVSVVLNFNYGVEDAEIWIPDYGNDSCFLSSCARGPYLYYVIGLLLALSSIFCSLAVRDIFNFRKGTEAVRKARNVKDVHGIVLYGKLILLMGMTWLMELIYWIFSSSEDPDSAPEALWFWIFVDIFNLFFTACFILFFLLCKPGISKDLCQQYNWIKVANVHVSKWMGFIKSKFVQCFLWNKEEESGEHVSLDKPGDGKFVAYCALNENSSTTNTS